MRNGSSRLRSPLRLLAASTGLLLMCLVAMQTLPWLRGKAAATHTDGAAPDALASAVEPSAGPTAIVEDDQAAESAPTLSGSAAGDVSRSPTPRPDWKPTTIDVKLRRTSDDSVPLPPPVPIDDEISDSKLRQLNERIEDLERETADWKRELTAAAPEFQAELGAMRQKFDDQQSELRSVSQQVVVLEERLRMLQVELNSVEPPRSGAHRDGSAAARVSIRSLSEKGQSLLVLDARDASLPELLARLGEMSGVNLLVAANVTGSISLHLKAANSDEALDAICRAHHCQQDRTGNIVLISRAPADEKLQAKSAVPETVTKLYRLQHLSGPEIRPYVQAVLTPGLGTVSFASIRERVARTEYRDPPRAILVKDTAQVISDVDRLILELDRPPTRGKALRPLSQFQADPRPKPVPMSILTNAKQPAWPPAQPPAILPPSEAWPSPRPASSPQSVSAPLLELPSAPSLLPTGSDLPGPCLDDEEFEPPLVREETIEN